MKTMFQQISSYKWLLISLLSTIFIIFPNIACMPWELSYLPESKHPLYFLYFGYRYVYFFGLIGFLLWYNLYKIQTMPFRQRLFRNLLVTGSALALYAGISFVFPMVKKEFVSTLLSQFCIIWIATTFAGHMFLLYSEQQMKELEIERLKNENLQSRCDALSNQINPHFFFNSLNGLSALIRKKEDEKTLAYVNKLSDVFRYILQSDKKGLVTLREELEFVESFRYMMEVRFANKLVFTIAVDEADMGLKIPVLSILPLIDNVVMHNTIDSDHQMEVSVRLTKEKELVVTNPVFPKRVPSDTNGTGLRNLENRFALLMDKQIRITHDEKTFSVYLPLK